jgi:hypothetical protein
MKTNYVVYGLVAVAIVAGLMHLFTNEAVAPVVDDESGDVMCPADAMECPDGSYVGRVAPSCEFAVCPEMNAAETNQMIQVNAPQSGQVISSPLQLTGEATGPWYFEASAPVELRDWQGNVIAQSYITAQGDWMVTNFVAFTGEITFNSPYTTGDPIAQQQGTLVFKKDNPSGEPQFDDQVVVPIMFTPQ